MNKPLFGFLFNLSFFSAPSRIQAVLRLRSACKSLTDRVALGMNPFRTIPDQVPTPWPRPEFLKLKTCRKVFYRLC